MFGKRKRRISLEKVSKNLSKWANYSPVDDIIKAEHPEWNPNKKEVKKEQEQNSFSKKNKKIIDLKMDEPEDGSKSVYVEPADDDIIYGVDKNIKLKKGRSANVNVEGALNSKEKSINANYVTKKGASVGSNYDERQGAGIEYTSPKKRSINVNVGKDNKNFSASYSSPKGSFVSGRYVPGELVSGSYSSPSGKSLNLEYNKNTGFSGGYSSNGMNVSASYKPKENINLNYTNKSGNQVGATYNPSTKSGEIRANIKLKRNKK